MNRIAFRNAALFDSRKGVLRRGATVLIEGERISHVAFQNVKAADFRSFDLKGKALLPGLIDCHVHVTATTHDIVRLSAQPPSLITALSKDILEGMLLRGFTTVRDAAGADFGLQEAVERGLFAGPRLFIAGWPLTQTGGHADARPRGAKTMFCTCAGLGLFGAICDGVAEVRRAAREQLRNGANHLKVMAGGGVMSPNDPIEGAQYSVEEMRAICEEAENAGKYVMAHAYSPRSIERAVGAGVRSIEHGNLLDARSARAMKTEGAYLVPTLATYSALAADANLGLTPEMLEKLERVKARGVDAIRRAKAEGIPIAFGTDLLGHMHAFQSEEFGLRLPAMKPAEILQSATSVGAELVGQSGKLGVIAPGAAADLIVAAGDPLKDLAPLRKPEKGLLAVMKAGRFYRNRL
ncbi:MAG TPA: amidohydrolase family protein [Burkholderiales bacterium]|nr:amidohydrolase family protein [Burkholderiales bacterium]